MKCYTGTLALLLFYCVALPIVFLSLDMRFALAHSATNHLNDLEGIATDFALALLNRDPGSLRPHLHPEFKASGGSMSGSRRLNVDQFLGEVFARAETDLNRLKTRPDGVGVRLGPIMVGVGSGEIAHILAVLHMLRVEGEWLIRRISYESELAYEMRREAASEYLELQEVAFRVVGPDGEDIPALRVSIGGADGRYWPPLPLHVGELAIDTALGCLAAVDLLTWGDAYSPLGDRPSFGIDC